jgi:hypothetical protein
MLIGTQYIYILYVAHTLHTYSVNVYIFLLPSIPPIDHFDFLSSNIPIPRA